MKARLDSFSGRLTRTVVITVLVTMTIISVFVFLVAASGILVFSKAHYSDILEKANRDMALTIYDGNTSAERLVADMTEAVNRFIGNAEQSDDLTMLVLKWREKSI